MEQRPLETQPNISRAATAQLMVFGTLLECGIGLLAVVAGWVLKLPLWEVVRWEPAAFAIGAGATLPMLLAVPILKSMPGKAFRELRRLIARTIVPIFRSATLAEIAMISSVAGIGEEAFFRGIIQRGLTELLGTGSHPAWWEPYSMLAIVVSATLFGLTHPLSKLYVALTVVIGIYLGILFAHTGNLVVCFTAHALYDFLVVLYISRFWSENDRESRGTS